MHTCLHKATSRPVTMLPPNIMGGDNLNWIPEIPDPKEKFAGYFHKHGDIYCFDRDLIIEVEEEYTKDDIKRLF